MSEFDAARAEAVMSQLLRYVRRRPTKLLSLDELKGPLRLRSLIDRGVQEIPLEKIVGTLGRAREFNRAFLPRLDASRERWTRIEQLAKGAVGFPPIDVYQVGEIYFVVDGHHRVSVARQLEAPTIEANVREFVTQVEVTVDDDVEAILLKSGRADFLDATGLAAGGPDDYRLTSAAGYERLLEHIVVHRYFRGLDLDREFGWDEAVASWRDLVYRPVVRVVQESGIMEYFPGRTEADLYLFTMDHLQHLKEQYGDRDVAAPAAVRHLRLQAHAAEPRTALSRAWRWLRGALE